jgi:hypothetical protein
MPRPKGTPNKPKEALDPGLANLATIALDMNLDESVRQEAAQALKTAMEPPAPDPAPHPEPTDPFAGCDEWPPAGHRNCVYDSHGMYRDGGAQDVTCLIDPLRKHSFPFQDARAKDGYIDLDALDALEKELDLL